MCSSRRMLGGAIGAQEWQLRRAEMPRVVGAAPHNPRAGLSKPGRSRGHASTLLRQLRAEDCIGVLQGEGTFSSQPISRSVKAVSYRDLFAERLSLPPETARSS